MRSVSLKLGAALCALLLVAHPAFASKANSAAATYIETLGRNALSTISDKNLTAEQKQTTLEKLFKENLDFDWVAKFVMGRFWKQATDAQKASYIEAYKNFLTRHYTSRFSEYTSGSFKITGAKPLEKGEEVVGMEIVPNDAGDPPVLIDYKIRKTGKSFKVYDIIVEGVSLITTQRSEFASVLNKSGIDGLIAQLSAK